MRLATLLAALLVASCSRPALAWDPFGDDFDAGDITPSDPEPFVVPEGLYVVTDVYAGDVVSTYGDTTTYSTATVQETPGTYARVVDVVGSGATSAFDGASFNDRASLPDGRPVGGTYYEDFVLTSGGFVSVNIVFFQDDSATRASTTTTPPPSPAPSSVPLPATTPPPFVVATTPFAPPASPTPAPEPDEPVPTPAPRIATAGVALAPGGRPLASIEVLRGRHVQLWPRAFLDGQPVAVRTWRLAAGQIDVASRRDGSGTDPCDASWTLMPPAGAAYTLRLDVTTDAAPGRVLSAIIAVTIRSPALGQ
jgi:hypothetical protein